MALDPRLRLRHITCFLEIARAGSLTAAADRLNITQPAASKTLRELEQILGRALFDRSGRRLRLNAEGLAFQKRAGAGMAELDRAQAAVRGAQTMVTKLAVGALPTAATDLLPRAALAFRARHPDCLLRVSTGPNWLLLSQLREGALDIVVGRMAEPARMTGLTFRQLYSEDVVAVVRPDHPLERLTPPEAFLDHPLIVPPSGAVLHATVRSYLITVGAGSVEPVFETVSLAFGRRAVQLSDAIWFISRGVVAEELALGALRALPLDGPMLAGPVGFSLREGAVPGPELAALTETLEETAAQIRAAQTAP